MSQSQAVKDFNKGFDIIMYLVNTILWPASAAIFTLFLFSSKIVPGWGFALVFWLGVVFVIIRLYLLFGYCKEEMRLEREAKAEAERQKAEYPIRLAELEKQAKQAERKWKSATNNFIGAMDDSGKDISIDQIMSDDEFDAIEQAYEDARKALYTHKSKSPSNWK